MKIGFTGTQLGMSLKQKEQLRLILKRDMPEEFHHGDCIGADSEAHDIALVERVKMIVIHPPLNTKKQANCFNRPSGKTTVILCPPKDYLDRNKDIVFYTDGLVVAPKSDIEEIRSGTWSTYRYAKRIPRLHILLER